MAWMCRRVLPLVAALLVSGGPALAGGGGHGGECYQTAPELDDRWVAAIDNCFAPNAIDVRTGQIVRWQVDGGMPHTVTFAHSAVGSGSMSRGMSYAVQFNAPGSYEYECLIHPGMIGRVEVAGVAVAGPKLGEIGETVSSSNLEKAANTSSVQPPAGTVLVGFDAGAGLTLVLFGLALGAGAALVTRIRRPLHRDDTARS